MTRAAPALHPVDYFQPKLQLFEGADQLKNILKDMLLYRDMETQSFWPIKKMIEVTEEETDDDADLAVVMLEAVGKVAASGKTENSATLQEAEDHVRKLCRALDELIRALENGQVASLSQLIIEPRKVYAQAKTFLHR